MKLSQLLKHTHGARLSVLFVFLLMIMPMKVIDAMGNTIIKTSIAEGKQQLNISDLKEGVYKAIIQTENELLYRTFHVGR